MNEIQNSADKVNAALSQFEKSKGVQAIGGFVNGFISLYSPSDLEVILNAI